MKMLTLAILLLSFPLISNAKEGRYYGYDSHHQEHDAIYFLEEVERRQHKQHRRIDRGIENGQLTQREVRKLERKQRHLAKKIRRLKHHNYISSSSKRRIFKKLDKLSHKIHHLKHNRHYVRHEKHYNQHVNKRHYDDHAVYRNYNQKPDYRKKRHLSVGHNDHSAGLYFRF